jgi:CubicO group peptidase (beta-lactamase class C family)
VTWTFGARSARVAALLSLSIAAAAQPDALPSDADARAALQRFMIERAAQGFSGVVLVARGDTVLLEQGYGFLDAARARPVAVDSVFTTGSITKQFTAAAILKLEEQRRLSTSDPIEKHLPGVPADKRAITLHHLLTHTAGFDEASGDDLEPIGRDALVALVLGRPLVNPIGEYRYSNVGYSLLAAIVERASGQAYETFLAERLFRPAGMTDTGYSRPRWAPARLAHAVNDDGTDRGTFGEAAMPNGTPGWHLLGNGGVLSTARDMYRWHRALMGTPVLSEASKARLYAPWADEGRGSHYGYGWSVEDTRFGRLVTHNGGNPYFFADFLRYLDSGVVVYYATNSRDRAMRRLARPLAQIAHTGRVLDVGTGAGATRTYAIAAPGSPAERLARRFLETVAADQATRRVRVAEIFETSLIERRSTDALVAFFDRVKADIGSAALLAIEESRGPGGAPVAVRLRFEGRSLVLVLGGAELKVASVELETD